MAGLRNGDSSPGSTFSAARDVNHRCESVNVAMEVSGAPPAGLRLTFEVSSLIGAMWLQFALAGDGNRAYRSCPECGEWWDATEARRRR